MVSKRITRVVTAVLKQHAAVVLLLHVGLIFSSLVISWLLRFDFTLRHRNILFATAPVLVLFRLAAIARYKLLHGNWRYTGVDDAGEILKATAVGSIAFFLTVRYVLHLTAFPLSVYCIEAILSAGLLGGTRLGFRVLAEAANSIPPGPARKQIVIIGAGFAAQMIMRELRQASSPYWVLGCVDDDRQKVGRKLQGKPVLGTVDRLPEIAAEHGIAEVLVAVPSATGAQMRRFVQICESAGLRSSTVPALHDLISGKCKISDVHAVNLDDLLGREPVDLDLDSVRGVVSDRTVLVTGAAGSIGSELCRQILDYGPAKLICLDQSETGLFYLQMELGKSRYHGRTVFCVADYGDAERMRRVFSQNGIDIVFHAAAYKHVPLMEDNPREALQNNVYGLLRFMEVARTHRCGSFVAISSDKAVNPSSIMGCTKRLVELILASYPEAQMRCVSVRFGNVLGSQGSVVPLFQKQISELQRITVTHPEITRFFMTIREAVSLVLQGAAIGEHGDILVLDMGEPVRILDLARTLIRLSGKSEKDIEIAFTGLRPGEKLYEELFYNDEEILETSCQKIKRTCETLSTWSELKASLDEMEDEMYKMSDDQVRFAIKGIIPQYSCAVSHEILPEIAIAAFSENAAAQHAGA